MRCAFGRLAALRLDIEVDRLVVRALRVAAPEARRVLVQAGLDAGLPREDTIKRAATCFFTSSAFNLSDDLSDDDCDYLPPAPAQAVVLILHSLFVAGLRDLHLPSGASAPRPGRRGGGAGARDDLDVLGRDAAPHRHRRDR